MGYKLNLPAASYAPLLEAFATGQLPDSAEFEVEVYWTIGEGEAVDYVLRHGFGTLQTFEANHSEGPQLLLFGDRIIRLASDLKLEFEGIVTAFSGVDIRGDLCFARITIYPKGIPALKR
jgi:hypothetical protein